MSDKVFSTSRYYPVEIYFSRERNVYIAIAPDLDGCSAGGDTRMGAVGAIERNMKAWIEAAKRTGYPIPEPKVRS
jgi:predicted RNase H-like HicB family nuclease